MEALGLDRLKQTAPPLRLLVVLHHPTRCRVLPVSPTRVHAQRLNLAGLQAPRRGGKTE